MEDSRGHKFKEQVARARLEQALLDYANAIAEYYVLDGMKVSSPTQKPVFNMVQDLLGYLRRMR